MKMQLSDRNEAIMLLKSYIYEIKGPEFLNAAFNSATALRFDVSGSQRVNRIKNIKL